MSKRTFGKLLRTSGLLIVALFAVTWVAFADNTIADGDGITPVAGNALSFGEVCVDSSTSDTALVAVSRNGSSTGTNTFANSANVIVAVNTTSGSGLSASMVTGSITLPSNWTTLDNNTMSNAVAADVHFDAPASPGAFTGSVTFRASGENTSGATINRDTTMQVTATVVDCAPVDTTPPVITPSVVGTLGNNGWYTSNVDVSWTVVDNESTISSQSGCDLISITADQAATTYTCTATSAGGTNSESVTIKRDATAPTLNPTVSPDPAVLNGAATASANASDNLSGVASQNCDAVDTSSVGGGQSVNCTATDNAGNQNTANATYSVVYGFDGFGAPVNNGMLNVAKAGQAIPLKFRLVDADGVGVANLTAVKVTVASLSCSLGTTTDNVEEYAAGSSGLQNLGDGYYQFNWKTPTNYANSCKTMSLELSGGGTHTADFQFKK